MGYDLLELYGDMIDIKNEEMISLMLDPKIFEYLNIEEGNLINEDVLRYLLSTTLDLMNKETHRVLKSTTDLIKELPLTYSSAIIDFVYSTFSKNREYYLDFLKDVYKTVGIDLDDLDDINFISRIKDFRFLEEITYSLKIPSLSYLLIKYELSKRNSRDFDLIEHLKYDSLYRAIPLLKSGKYTKLNDLDSSLIEIERILTVSKSKNVGLTIFLNDLLKYIFLEDEETKNKIIDLYWKIATYKPKPTAEFDPEDVIYGYVSSVFKSNEYLDDKLFVFNFVFTRVKIESIHDMIQILNLSFYKRTENIERLRTLDKILPKPIKVNFMTLLDILSEDYTNMSEESMEEILKHKSNPYVKLRLSLRKK